MFETSDEMHASVEDDSLDVTADDILVLKNCGPKGYPGMAEVGNMPLPAKLLRQGVTDMVRISDARMSGTAYGTVVLHAAPEAAAGGNLALVQNGDIIELDVERRRLHLEVSDEELKRRRSAWKASEGSDAARLHEAVLRSCAASGQRRRPRFSGRRQRLRHSQRQPLSRYERARADHRLRLSRYSTRARGFQHRRRRSRRGAVQERRRFDRRRTRMRCTVVPIRAGDRSRARRAAAHRIGEPLRRRVRHDRHRSLPSPRRMGCELAGLRCGRSSDARARDDVGVDPPSDDLRPRCQSGSLALLVGRQDSPGEFDDGRGSGSSGASASAMRRWRANALPR